MPIISRLKISVGTSVTPRSERARLLSSMASVPDAHRVARLRRDDALLGVGELEGQGQGDARPGLDRRESALRNVVAQDAGLAALDADDRALVDDVVVVRVEVRVLV